MARELVAGLRYSPRPLHLDEVRMTDRIADRGLVNEPVYITDLSAVEPADAVGPVPAFHRWRAMAYTAGDLSGQMLLAGPETAAPDLSRSI